MFPAIVRGFRDGDAEERAPLRAFRFADEVHIRLVGEAVALAGIAGDAGANDVFP